MSRLLLYKPRSLNFKHFIETDIGKWRAKYRSVFNCIDKLANYGHVNTLASFAILHNSKKRIIYGRLALHGWIDRIDKNLVRPSEGCEFIDDIWGSMFAHAFHNCDLEHIDVVYRYRHLVYTIYPELNMADCEKQFRTLSKIYKCATPTCQKELYGKLIILFHNFNTKKHSTV